jgi:NAD(P)H-quinone oxidoreductase subunit 5
LSGAVIVLGLLTALYASVTSRVQTDVKSALAFASMTQVGLIVAEIGAGLRYLALVHIVGHACLRTLQFLRAPNLLHDYHTLENAVGANLRHAPRESSRLLPNAMRPWLYRFAHQRGYLDALLMNFVVLPFRTVFLTCDAAERKWTALLSREALPKPADPRTPAEIDRETPIGMDEMSPDG